MTSLHPTVTLWPCCNFCISPINMGLIYVYGVLLHTRTVSTSTEWGDVKRLNHVTPNLSWIKALLLIEGVSLRMSTYVYLIMFFLFFFFKNMIEFVQGEEKSPKQQKCVAALINWVWSESGVMVGGWGGAVTQPARPVIDYPCTLITSFH